MRLKLVAREKKRGQTTASSEWLVRFICFSCANAYFSDRISSSIMAHLCICVFTVQCQPSKYVNKTIHKFTLKAGFRDRPFEQRTGIFHITYQTITSDHRTVLQLRLTFSLFFWKSLEKPIKMKVYLLWNVGENVNRRWFRPNWWHWRQKWSRCRGWARGTRGAI